MNENECSICLESIEDLLKKNEFEYFIECSNCNYKCCISCINKWYIKTKICPICKKFNTFDINFEYSLSSFEEEDLSIKDDQPNLFQQIFNEHLQQLLQELNVPHPPPQVPLQVPPPPPSQQVPLQVPQQVPPPQVSLQVPQQQVPQVSQVPLLIYNNNRTKVLNPSTNRFVSVLGKIGKNLIKNIQN